MADGVATMSVTYKECSSKKHHLHSPHEKTIVPFVLFLKLESDPRSPQFKMCKHCRDYGAKGQSKLVAKKIAMPLRDGYFFCTRCNVSRLISERGVRLDGDMSQLCCYCAEQNRTYPEKNRQVLRKLKLDIIKQNNCMCLMCNRFFLKTTEKTGVEILQISNGFVTFQGVTITPTELICNFESLLEPCVLDFDHLVEAEQRERGILNEEDVYIAKVDYVSKLSSSAMIEREAKKCQLICVECHLNVTISREKGSLIGGSTSSISSKEKQAFVQSLKDAGCSLCQRKCDGNYRFFDMDHIDPMTKMEIISHMTRDKQFTLDDVIKECAKTRVLCKFCHRVHTKKQRQDGTLANKRRKIDTDQ